MTRPLRILTFLHSFEPGGVERVALRLHQAWTAKGIDARLVLGRDDGVQWHDWPGLAYRSLAVRWLNPARFETLWLIARLPGAIRRERPDVLFCAGNTYAVVAVAMKLWLGRACPPIVAKVSNDLSRQDRSFFERRAYRWWLRVQGRLIDRFVGMAAPMAAEIGEAMAVAPDRVAIVNDPAVSAAEIARFAAARPVRRGTGTRFVAVGRLVPQKNFPLLLEAFAAAARPRDRLAILGEGPERRALVQRARELGIERRVDLPGHIGSVVDALRASDVLVLSSDYEGVPAVIIEALAAGLAVVATDCSVSMASLLGGGALGTLVPVGNAAALARAMRAAATTQPDADAARAQAGRFTVETAASAYVAIWADLASACRAAANANSQPPRRPSHSQQQLQG